MVRLLFIDGVRRCEVEGCERKHLAKGKCGMHYQQVKRGVPQPPKLCDVEGCEQKHYGEGKCKKHYQQAYLQRPEVKLREQKRKLSPEHKTKKRKTDRKRSQTQEYKDLQKKYRQKPKAKMFTLKRTHDRRLRVKGAEGSYTPEEEEALRDLYGGICPFCGKREPFSGRYPKLTIDHIIHLSKGGTNNIENIQLMCISCNARKQDRVVNL